MHNSGIRSVQEEEGVNEESVIMDRNKQQEQQPKRGRKLELLRETVRRLDAADLSRVVGGGRQPSYSCHVCAVPQLKP